MASKPNIVAGLDIGSSKVSCFIAELDHAFNPRVIGYGQHASSGMRKGMIVDMDRTENAIREAVMQAEEMADINIDSVYVGLGGVHLRSHITDGLVVLNNHEITDADIFKVIDVARAKQIEGDRKIIHAQATKYQLDNQSDIRDPRGMTGARLESEVHIISAASSAVRNMVRCVERCHLEVEDLVVQPYASALSCLVPDERDLGVCLVDIGGGTCEIAIYAEGSLLHVAVVPVGGQHITSDIARGLSTPLAHAERVKNLYGSAMASLVPSDEQIDVPHVGENEDTASSQISRSALAGIIQPRCEEMLEMVREKIEQSGFESSIGRRVVLTGGGSQLNGLKQLTEVILDKSVRLARPTEINGLTDLSGAPQFSCVAGLVIHAARQSAVQAQQNKRTFSSIFNHVGKFFKESLQNG
jgi:cell division protein FtsA